MGFTGERDRAPYSCISAHLLFVSVLLSLPTCKTGGVWLRVSSPMSTYTSCGARQSRWTLARPLAGSVRLVDVLGFSFWWTVVLF